MARRSRTDRLPVFDRRRAGALLDIASLLPTAGAGGVFGARARAWIDWLATAGFSVWQLLPVGPVGSDGSPYWTRSDHAGDPRLLGGDDRDRLVVATPEERAAYAAFCKRSAAWLDDYALFVALGESQPAQRWWEWPVPLRDRETDALRAARAELAPRIERVALEQFRFECEWRALREYAHARGVRLFGDLPIYVAPDAVDVWAHRDQFQLDAAGRPTAVAGVPPDYFSEKGQLWGNPLYEWNRARRTGFAFWRARIAHQLERFDVLRIDHFRGLAAHWAVPASAEDARAGAWRDTPGHALLGAVRRDFPDLPFVAEDLGVITPDVVKLQSDFGLPGMRVLQFGFDGNPASPHLPHNHVRHSIVYTGTHDNDTSLGWYATLDGATLGRVNDYLRIRPGEMPEAFVRTALGSVAELAVIPAQDLLGLDSSARLNTPGTVGGNWVWRLDSQTLPINTARHLAWLNYLYGRAAAPAH
jgi:4-alpha-glucanotransferase